MKTVFSYISTGKIRYWFFWIITSGFQSIFVIILSMINGYIINAAALGDISYLERIRNVLLPLIIICFLGYLFTKQQALQIVVKLQQQLRCHVWEKLFGLSQCTGISQDISRITTDVSSMTNLYQDVIPAFILSVISFVVTMVTISSYNGWILLLTLLVGGVYSLTIYFGKKIDEAATSVKQIQADTLSCLLAINRGTPIFQIYPNAKLFIKYYSENLNRWKEKGNRLIGLQAVIIIVAWLTSIAREIVILLIGLSILHTKLGDILTMMILSSNINNLISNFSQNYINWKNNIPSARRIQEIFNLEFYEVTEQVKSLSGDINITNLVLNYGSEKEIFSNVCFKFKEYFTTGIIGPIGSGKSTILKMLMGFIWPEEGKVYIGDTQLTHANQKSWREQFAYVDQQCNMFNGSLKENITSFSSSTDISLLQKSIRIAQLEDVVKKLPNGIDTQLADKENELSGGERQRVAIARAIYSERKYLLMDEITSALDVVNIQNLIEAIKELKGKMTIILVTHQPEILELADEVIKVKEIDLFDS